MQKNKELTIRHLFYSLIEVLSTAVDERAPYHANHTRNMVSYIENVVDYINRQHKQGVITEYFDEDRKEQLIMSAWLHDIGKLITPIEVIEKATRLANKQEVIVQRFKYIRALLKVSYLEGKISKAIWESSLEELEEACEHVKLSNQAPELSREMIGKTKALAKKTYTDLDGEVYPWLTENEVEALCISKGTLTIGEREIMKQHVLYTEKLLSKIEFIDEFSEVPSIASRHHEYINGTGYPNGLTGEHLSFEVRLLVIMDILEALLATDRPYKDAVDAKDAFAILEKMAEEGKVDCDILGIVKAVYEEGTLLETDKE